jgi:hypothetical protein
MIPATPGRGENKAGMEGEFGKFEQAVGMIYLSQTIILHQEYDGGFLT